MSADSETLIRWLVAPIPDGRVIGLRIGDNLARLQTREIIGFRKEGERNVIQYSEWREIPVVEV
jgi:hypothetical protein